MLYGKKTLILEEATSTLLSNEIRKMSNQEEQTESGLGSREEKEEKKKKRSKFIKGVSLLS